MKKAAYFLAGLCLFAFVTACSSEDDEEETVIVAQSPIVGVWKIESIFDVDNNEDLVVDDCRRTFNTYQYNADGTFSIEAHKIMDGSCQLEGTYTGTYSVDGNILTILEEETESQREILVLDANTLKLKMTDNHGTYLDTYVRE